MRAKQLLVKAQVAIEDRATEYDSKKGERSIPKTVAMFNALTGHKLTTKQGWKFMCCLKLVRSEQGTHKNDNYIDGAAYFALAGEVHDVEDCKPAIPAIPCKDKGEDENPFD